MKNIIPLIVVAAIIIAIGVVIYIYVIKPPEPIMDSQPLPPGVPPVVASISLTGALSPQTLGKIQTACSAPTSKIWFENMYKTKCSNYGF